MYTYEMNGNFYSQRIFGDFLPVGWSGRKVEIFALPQYVEKNASGKDHAVFNQKGENDFLEIAVREFNPETVKAVLAELNQTTSGKIQIIETGPNGRYISIRSLHTIKTTVKEGGDKNDCV